MSGIGAERIAELDKYTGELLNLVPDAVKSYGALSKAAQTPGALDREIKELIASPRAAMAAPPIAAAGRCRSPLLRHGADGLWHSRR